MTHRCPPPPVLAALASCLTLALVPALAQPMADPHRLDAPEHLASTADAAQPSVAMSADVRALLRWIARSGDNQGSNFVVINKRQAHIWLFDAGRMPAGDSPVLLGRAHGDRSVPSIGTRAMADIKPRERITPAGRFRAEVGTNLSGEDIFWIDYDAAVSMHRLRPVSAWQRRPERMATPTPLDNRISWGCVNVPPAFYERRLLPLFSPEPGLVYVLPDTEPLSAFFAEASVERAAPDSPPASRVAAARRVAPQLRSARGRGVPSALRSAVRRVPSAFMPVVLRGVPSAFMPVRSAHDETPVRCG